VEEVLRILEGKARKHGEIGKAFLEDVRPSFEKVYGRDPGFAKAFAESLPASYFKDINNAEVTINLLNASLPVLEAHREPGKELTQYLLDLILAAARRCHTSTKYHVFNLIQRVARRVGIFGVAQGVKEFGRPSRSNVARISRAALLYTHPDLRFSKEEAQKNHKVAGIAYLAELPEFEREWVERIREGGDVLLDKTLKGSFELGNKLILLSNSLRRTLEALDVHHSCLSPHHTSTNTLPFILHPMAIPLIVLEKGKVKARISLYHDPGSNRVFVGSKIYGYMSKEEALRIFEAIKENMGVDMYVPGYYFGNEEEGEIITFETSIDKKPIFPINDDYISLGEKKAIVGPVL